MRAACTSRWVLLAVLGVAAGLDHHQDERELLFNKANNKLCATDMRCGPLTNYVQAVGAKV